MVSVTERECVQRHIYIYVTYGTEGVKARSWGWPAGFLVTVKQLAGQKIE